MRSGDRPGLQNRRWVSYGIHDGFDSHSLPPMPWLVSFEKHEMVQRLSACHSERSTSASECESKNPYCLAAGSPPISFQSRLVGLFQQRPVFAQQRASLVGGFCGFQLCGKCAHLRYDLAKRGGSFGRHSARIMPRFRPFVRYRTYLTTIVPLQARKGDCSPRRCGLRSTLRFSSGHVRTSQAQSPLA
jgi:hypothetical protein